MTYAVSAYATTPYAGTEPGALLSAQLLMQPSSQGSLTAPITLKSASLMQPSSSGAFTTGINLQSAMLMQPFISTQLLLVGPWIIEPDFYVRPQPISASPSIVDSQVIGIKDPAETIPLTVDAGGFLETGETITGVISTSVTTIIGTDANPGTLVESVQINSSALSLGTLSMPVGTVLECVLTGGVDRVTYRIDLICQTNNPYKTIVLKTILPVSAV